MEQTEIPSKFSVPWANTAGSQYVRNVPRLSQQSNNPGAASLEDGFPPLNFINVNAGGIPPHGADFNGILKLITRWLRWNNAGGLVKYDAAFSGDIGGYPRGAIVMSSSGHALYQSLTDNNLADPASSTTQWKVVSSVWSGVPYQAGGAANAQSITLSPAPTSYLQMTNIPIRFISQGTNTTTVSINVNGLGIRSIQTAGGVVLAPQALVTGAVYEITYNGSAFILSSQPSVYNDVGNLLAGLQVYGSTNSAGANFLLVSNGATTPKKWVRAWNGRFQVMNDAYTNVFDVEDNGNGTFAGALTANGNIQANNGRLRAAFGAYNTGDSNVAALLGDFFGHLVNDGYCRLPNGLLIQSTNINVNIDNNPYFFTFPVAFAGACTAVMCIPGAFAPAAGAMIGAQPVSLTQFQVTIASNTPGGSLGVWYIAVGV